MRAHARPRNGTIPRVSASGGQIGRTVERLAPAKVNLCLSVASPEPQGSPKAGWHRIASWFACVSLFDTVRLRAASPGDEGSFRVSWAHDAPRPTPIDWPAEKDLALRARLLLERVTGRALPTHVEVTKRIPVAAGLGGGSSDAAATLLGLDELFGLGLGPRRLAEVGAALGSDVSFFCDRPSGTPRQALVGGFGDEVERVEPVPGRLTLWLPAFGCATPAVYRAFDARLGGVSRPADDRRVRLAHRACLERGGIEPGALFNDLASAACDTAPGLGALLGSLEGAGRRGHVTGSGSAVFEVGGEGGPKTGPRIPDNVGQPVAAVEVAVL